LRAPMRANRIISTVALNPFLIDARKIPGKLLLSRKLRGLARSAAELAVLRQFQSAFCEINFCPQHESQTSIALKTARTRLRASVFDLYFTSKSLRESWPPMDFHSDNHLDSDWLSKKCYL
jgi:hypothetical protein